jgi:hypothetical protein
VFYPNIVYVALVIHVCCKCMSQMFQLFQTYIASVLSGCCICCSAHTHVANVCGKGGASKGGPFVRSGPRVHVGSEAGAEHKAVSMGVATGAEHEATSIDGQTAGVEHEATSIGRQQARSTKLYPQTS